MPNEPTIINHMHDRFRTVFGEPAHTLNNASQWSVSPGPKAPTIVILLNGTYEKPTVWIFDPFAAENVSRTSISSIPEVDAVIHDIQTHIAHATSAWAA